MSTVEARESERATALSAAERFGIVEKPDLTFTPEIASATAHLYERVKDFIPAIEWPVYAPYVHGINRLKKERNAVILAHNYQTPDIFHCVADIVGDSLQLARDATRVDAEIIVQCGVHFMAETSKLLNPDKTVLIPDGRAGCSLSESITGADVRLLRERYPGVPVVTYVNTSADVKAETDICCTSSNVLDVVESLESDTVLCIPDEYLAMNVARQTKKKILTWKGHCEVHERFTAEELLEYKKADPTIEIVAHPECHPSVLEVSDYAGSTSGMINYVKTKRPPRVLLVTECSMASNIQAEVRDVDFIKPCNLCPHMKRITLPKILDSLVFMTEEVLVDPAIAGRARLAVERMVNLKQ
ncbi:quinolinate synthase NadA [Rhizobiaceae bacterium n13]|uniref:Quinolinate synthase n=2 Tax=Ferirhizobium litorale TaxID=2927786 RepID=A0AAE3QC60_9HYPH|nr:quinolinate synthase NadA [Fererhizobium litorale]MDI7861131.1 quinolinate synthase NadA [Fererhizobium litorale]MDI7921278.1 quinolinate synthase NadA [Fererhizobium litorale]